MTIDCRWQGQLLPEEKIALLPFADLWEWNQKTKREEPKSKAGEGLPSVCRSRCHVTVCFEGTWVPGPNKISLSESDLPEKFREATYSKFMDVEELDRTPYTETLWAIHETWGRAGDGDQMKKDMARWLKECHKKDQDIIFREADRLNPHRPKKGERQILEEMAKKPVCQKKPKQIYRKVTMAGGRTLETGDIIKFKPDGTAKKTDPYIHARVVTFISDDDREQESVTGSGKCVFVTLPLSLHAPKLRKPEALDRLVQDKAFGQKLTERDLKEDKKVKEDEKKLLPFKIQLKVKSDKQQAVQLFTPGIPLVAGRGYELRVEVLTEAEKSIGKVNDIPIVIDMITRGPYPSSQAAERGRNDKHNVTENLGLKSMKLKESGRKVEVFPYNWNLPKSGCYVVKFVCRFQQRKEDPQKWLNIWTLPECHVKPLLRYVTVKTGPPQKMQLLPVDHESMYVGGEAQNINFKLLDANGNAVAMNGNDVGNGLLCVTVSVSIQDSQQPCTKKIPAQLVAGGNDTEFFFPLSWTTKEGKALGGRKADKPTLRLSIVHRAISIDCELPIQLWPAMPTELLLIDVHSKFDDLISCTGDFPQMDIRLVGPDGTSTDFNLADWHGTVRIQNEDEDFEHPLAVVQKWPENVAVMIAQMDHEWKKLAQTQRFLSLFGTSLTMKIKIVAEATCGDLVLSQSIEGSIRRQILPARAIISRKSCRSEEIEVQVGDQLADLHFQFYGSDGNVLSEDAVQVSSWKQENGPQLTWNGGSAGLDLPSLHVDRAVGHTVHGGHITLSTGALVPFELKLHKLPQALKDWKLESTPGGQLRCCTKGLFSKQFRVWGSDAFGNKVDGSAAFGNKVDGSASSGPVPSLRIDGKDSQGATKSENIPLLHNAEENMFRVKKEFMWSHASGDVRVSLQIGDNIFDECREHCAPGDLKALGFKFGHEKFDMSAGSIPVERASNSRITVAVRAEDDAKNAAPDGCSVTVSVPTNRRRGGEAVQAASGDLKNGQCELKWLLPTWTVSAQNVKYVVAVTTGGAGNLIERKLEIALKPSSDPVTVKWRDRPDSVSASEGFPELQMELFTVDEKKLQVLPDTLEMICNVCVESDERGSQTPQYVLKYVDGYFSCRCTDVRPIGQGSSLKFDLRYGSTVLASRILRVLAATNSLRMVFEPPLPSDPITASTSNHCTKKLRTLLNRRRLKVVDKFGNKSTAFDSADVVAAFDEEGQPGVPELEAASLGQLRSQSLSQLDFRAVCLKTDSGGDEDLTLHLTIKCADIRSQSITVQFMTDAAALGSIKKLEANLEKKKRKVRGWDDSEAERSGIEQQLDEMLKESNVTEDQIASEKQSLKKRKDDLQAKASHAAILLGAAADSLSRASICELAQVMSSASDACLLSAHVGRRLGTIIKSTAEPTVPNEVHPVCISSIKERLAESKAPAEWLQHVCESESISAAYTGSGVGVLRLLHDSEDVKAVFHSLFGRVFVARDSESARKFHDEAPPQKAGLAKPTVLYCEAAAAGSEAGDAQLMKIDGTYGDVTAMLPSNCRFKVAAGQHRPEYMQVAKQLATLESASQLVERQKRLAADLDRDRDDIDSTKEDVLQLKQDLETVS